MKLYDIFLFHAKQRESWSKVLVNEKFIKAWSLLFKMYMISTFEREQN